jgi:hypothetical protein
MKGIAVLEVEEKTFISSVGDGKQEYILPVYTKLTKVDIAPSLSEIVTVSENYLFLMKDVSIMVTYSTFFDRYEVIPVDEDDITKIAQLVFYDPDFKKKFAEIFMKFSEKYEEMTEKIGKVIDALPVYGETGKLFNDFSSIDWQKVAVEILQGIKDSLPEEWEKIIKQKPDAALLVK